MKQDIIDIIENSHCLEKKHSILGVTSYCLKTNKRDLEIQISSDDIKLSGKGLLVSIDDPDDINEIKQAISDNLHVKQPEAHSLSLSDVKSEMGI